MTYRDPLIEALAERITHRGLVGPAVFLLELAKPFTFVLGQGLLLFQPVMALMGHDQALADLAHLLDDRANIERLLARLEKTSSPPEA
jgi:hypothetical protein